MPMVKISVTLGEHVAKEIERLVASGKFPNQSKVVQYALDEVLRDSKRRRLASECDRLDPNEEQSLAEESMEAGEWPAY